MGCLLPFQSSRNTQANESQYSYEQARVQCWERCYIFVANKSWKLREIRKTPEGFPPGVRNCLQSVTACAALSHDNTEVSLRDLDPRMFPPGSTWQNYNSSGSSIRLSSGR